MIEVMLFVKDFELGSKLSSACVDLDRQIEFTDETVSYTHLRAHET
mgnify:CR=1 FL=1